MEGALQSGASRRLCPAKTVFRDIFCNGSPRDSLERMRDLYLHRGLSSAGRALAWHARGQGFDPPRLHHFPKFTFVLSWPGKAFGFNAPRCGNGPRHGIGTGKSSRTRFPVSNASVRFGQTRIGKRRPNLYFRESRGIVRNSR